MNRLNGELQADRVRGHISRPTVVVVLIAPHETKEQAWRRHLKENPQDRLADVKIFHIAHPGIARKSPLSGDEELGPRTKPWKPKRSW